MALTVHRLVADAGLSGVVLLRRIEAALAISTVITCLLFCDQAYGEAAPLRVPLDVWSVGNHCRNEAAFWAAYQTNESFRTALDSRFVVRRVSIYRHPVTALLHGIAVGPTFAVPGRPLVVGYRGPAPLLNALGLPVVRPPPAQPDATDAPLWQAPEAKPREIDLEALRASLRDSISEQIEGIHNRLKDQQSRELIESENRTLTELERIADRLREQIDSDQAANLTALRELAEQLPRPLPRESWDELPPDEPAGESRGTSVRQLLVSVFETWPLIASIAAGGGATAVALPLVSWLWNRWRTRGRGATGLPSETACRNCPRLLKENERLSSRIRDLEQELSAPRVIDRTYVPYETSHFKEAFDAAVRETVRQYPGAHEGLEALEDMIISYLAAKGLRR